MDAIERMGAREAMNAMKNAVARELNDLHRMKRDQDDMISNLQRQIMINNQNAEDQRLAMQAKIDSLEIDKKFANDRVKKMGSVADQAIRMMYVACATTFIVIGYAVWIW